MKKPVRVLSVDGGGTRGLMPSTILHCLEKETGKRITDLFDVIVGAATGGIIVSSLAAGMPTEEIVKIYLNKASFILPSNFFRRLWNPLNLFAPKYPNGNLKQLLEEKFGEDKRFSDVVKDYGTDTIFLIAALNFSPDLVPGETPSFKIEIFNSSRTIHQNEFLTDVALRTSAAAINLPIYRHYGEGGNYANDPALAAFSFCTCDQIGYPDESLLPDNKLGLGADRSDIRLLSLGCGTDGNSFFPKEEIGKGNWGLIKWMNRLVNLVIDTNMVYTRYLLNEMLSSQQYLRINPYYKAESAPEVLKNEKLRIDVTKRAHLDAVKYYAEQTFEKEKQNISDFLEL